MTFLYDFSDFFKLFTEDMKDHDIITHLNSYKNISVDKNTYPYEYHYINNGEYLKQAFIVATKSNMPRYVKILCNYGFDIVKIDVGVRIQCKNINCDNYNKYSRCSCIPGYLLYHVDAAHRNISVTVSNYSIMKIIFPDIHYEKAFDTYNYSLIKSEFYQLLYKVKGVKPLLPNELIRFLSTFFY